MIFLLSCFAIFLFYATPLKGEINRRLVELSMAVIQAGQLGELSFGTAFETVPLGIGGCLFIALTVVGCGLVWRLGSAWAVIFFLLSCGFLIGAQAYAMVFFRKTLPLSDMVLFDSISMVAGGLWRMVKDGQLHIDQQVRMKDRTNLALSQTSLLEDFSSGLHDITSHIARSLEGMRFFIQGNGSLKTVMDQLIKSCDELRIYLNGIREFTQVTSRPNLVNKKTFNLRRTIDRVVLQLHEKTREKEISVEVDCASKLLIHSSEPLLEVILFNIVSNAIKYSFSLERVLIKAERHGRKRVEITVQDFGVGIAKESCELIFEKFYRVRDQNYNIPGNGLGLYLCRYFANKINAELTVESTIGLGTTMHIVLRRVVRGALWRR